MNANRHALLGVTLALAVPALLSAADPQGEAPVQPELQRLVESWRAEHGAGWQIVLDSATQHAKFLYGGTVAADVPPRTDAAFFDLARAQFAAAQDMMGIEGATLVPDKVTFLPLGLAGTTDKVTVQFRQAVDGVPVRRGFATALFQTNGDLLSLDTTGLPAVADLNTNPTVPATRAAGFALDLFRGEFGVAPTRSLDPVLEIDRDTSGKLARPTLVWEVRLLLEIPGVAPEGAVYRIAAQGTPRLVSREDAIHYFDVGGTVMTNATTGGLPDEAGNPPAPVPAAYMTVTGGGKTTTTDKNGNFNLTGVTGPTNVTFGFAGSFNDVHNNAGSDYSLVTSLNGTGNSVLLNPSPTEAITAQANAFVQIDAMRDWTRSINPADTTMDTVSTANVMLNSTCNAYYDGVSTNFYNAGGGCSNTAYSTVVHHENGHWQNDRYGSGNGPDGFGEGNADVYAMYQADDPIVGRDFCGTGCYVRTGLNTRQFCGDSNPGCYGEVHNDGEVLMGALWKVRRNLENSDPVNGGDTANLLFNGWMNAYNQGSINSIIETQWLTLDDDDGFIGNGTPHHQEIDDAFLEQGFPGHKLSFVQFTNVTTLQDTLDDIGPYGVAADLSPVFGSSVTSAQLHYRVNGGSFASLGMTNLTGDTWTALIPGIPSPAKVEWYISAMDDLGNPDAYPPKAPATTESFRIGTVQSYFFDDFETAGDNGWTHAQVQTQDDWQHDTPRGMSGAGWSDPSSAYSGAKAWGNDLGISGFNGAYQPNVVNYLQSPPIDLSGATGSILSFKRWLTVEEGIYDHAIIKVNGTQVWTNPPNGNLVDTSWQDFQLDISAQADGNPATVVEFRLESDPGLELGGWNIDDFQILSFEPSPTNCQPTFYGSGLSGTPGVPTIDTGRQPSQAGNSNFTIKVKNGLPGATAFLGVGVSVGSFSVFGGTLLIVPDSVLPVTLDQFGQFTLSAPLGSNPATVGQSYVFQAFVVDPGAVHGFAMTNGMLETICN